MTRIPAMLAIILAATAAVAPAATVTRITADGSGTVAVVPDEATVRATIVTNADRADDATSQNNATYQRVTDALVKSGIARSDFTLASYNLQYNPRPSPRPGEIAPEGTFGYVVDRAFNVKVRDVSKAGAVLDTLVAAGVTNENVTFDVSNPVRDRARSEAIAKAVGYARQKAEDAAKAAGLRITGIEQIGLGGAIVEPPQPAVFSAAVLRAAAVPTQLDAGNIDVRASVTIVFTAQP
jgi:uncharacterized protein